MERTDEKYINPLPYLSHYFQMCPAIDIKDILRKSLVNQKLVVTLPWIVQYISMLDAITLRLDYYRDVFEILYELYVMFTSFPSIQTNHHHRREQEQLAQQQQQQHQQEHHHPPQHPIRRPTSIFILRTCLGWLFDQPNVPNDYYQYRQNRKPLNTFNTASKDNNFIAVEIMIPKDIQQHFNTNKRMVLVPNDKDNNGQILNYSLERQQLFHYGPAANEQHQQQNLSATQCIRNAPATQYSLNLRQFDPLLEKILIAACPFLADFRVSIMPRKNSKTVSRTGRYRHVTTKLYESPSPSNRNLLAKSDEDPQTRLTEAFFQSQSLSVRRTVEFVLERTVSAVIKDYQVEHFIPIKRNVMAQVDAIDVSDVTDAIDGDGDGGRQQQAIEDKLYDIYGNGEQTMSAKWDQVLPTMIKSRVEVSIYSFLAHARPILVAFFPILHWAHGGCARRMHYSLSYFTVSILLFTDFPFSSFQKAFDALLPNETIAAVRNTCVNIVVQKCRIKTEEWKSKNLVGIGEY